MTSEADRTPARQLSLVAGLSVELREALAEGERLLYTDGDLLASQPMFERAYQIAEQLADAQAMAEAALGMYGSALSQHLTVTGAIMLEARLQRVLALLDPRSVLAFRIRLQLAAEADYQRGTSADTLRLLDEARARGDQVALADALAFAHDCVLGPEHISLRRELDRELLTASVWTERRCDRVWGLHMQTVDAYSAGDPHARRLLAELREELDAHDDLSLGFAISAIDVMLAIRSGQLDDAESLAVTCARLGVAAGDINADWYAGAQLVTIRWYQGRLPELLPSLRQRVDAKTQRPSDESAVAALAVASALDGDRLAAAACLASLCGSGLASVPQSSSWLGTMNGVVETAFLLSDAKVAAEAYELLRPYAGLPMIGGPAATCFGSVHQALGVSSLTTGDLDRAIEHFEAAVQQNLALGHWPAVLSSRQRLAAARTQRDQPGDAQAAELELGTARAEAASLGLAMASGQGSVGADVQVATCERAGRMWRVGLGGRSVQVQDSVGMLHLAVLIANPRQEILAADLVAGLASISASSASYGEASQRVLDEQAVREYRHRISSIDTELDQLAGGGDDDRAIRLRTERSWLLAQLASAAGLSGRARSFADEGERARVAVRKAIRRALARITEADERIGEHLSQQVRTGTRCSYWPG